MDARIDGRLQDVDKRLANVDMRLANVDQGMDRAEQHQSDTDRRTEAMINDKPRPFSWAR